MKKVVTFGELLLRLSPEDHLRFVQADRFSVFFGGAEANVAVTLAGLGIPSRFVTKLPAHEIGQSAVNFLRRYGVDTSYVARGGDRMGIYFLENGVSLRGDKCIYDRKDSAIAKASPEDFDFRAAFSDAGWFHFSGVTPAVSPELAKICLLAAKTAKEMGLTVSCDLNYRRKLWDHDTAKKTMTELMSYVDVCICNDEEPTLVFDIAPETLKRDPDGFDRKGYMSMAKQLKERFGFSTVGIVMRVQKNAESNLWLGMLYDGRDFAFSDATEVPLLDSTGGGDCFGAGVIYATLSDMPLKMAVDTAAAVSMLQLSVKGDACHVSPEEVMALASGNCGRRVQ